MVGELVYKKALVLIQCFGEGALRGNKAVAVNWDEVGCAKDRVNADYR